MNLVEQLAKQVGITEAQAKAGAGILLKYAEDKLGDQEFARLAQFIPGSADMMAAAPESGGLGSMLGGLASSFGGKAAELGGLASLADNFSKAGLSVDQIQEFVPVILSQVESKGGKEASDLLARVLKQ